jgi:hypothetical protein
MQQCNSNAIWGEQRQEEQEEQEEREWVQNMTRCVSLTVNHTRCKRDRVEGSTLCMQHFRIRGVAAAQWLADENVQARDLLVRLAGVRLLGAGEEGGGMLADGIAMVDERERQEAHRRMVELGGEEAAARGRRARAAARAAEEAAARAAERERLNAAYQYWDELIAGAAGGAAGGASGEVGRNP